LCMSMGEKKRKGLSLFNFTLHKKGKKCWSPSLPHLKEDPELKPRGWGPERSPKRRGSVVTGKGPWERDKKARTGEVLVMKKNSGLGNMAQVGN